MITDKEKDEIFETLVVFYKAISYNKSNLIYTFKRDYKTRQDFIDILYSENTRTFFRRSIRLQNADFVKHISNEFELYCIYNKVTLEDKKRWLNHTYNFIVPINELSGFINKSTVIDFVRWFKETLSDITEEKPQQFKAVNTNELHNNEFDKIFKNDLGFTIFIKMYEKYKGDKNKLANFSFLFWAMEKDFLVCSQTEFKEFLSNEKYNIEIEKIDRRQWFLDMNGNKKSKLYNSIKESLQEKHGLSTKPCR